MGNDESPEEQLSSFAEELEDVKGMCECVESRCLFLLDEFGKRFGYEKLFIHSTSIESGLALGWSLMEYLSKQHQTFTLFATHYLPERIKLIYND